MKTATLKLMGEVLRIELRSDDRTACATMEIEITKVIQGASMLAYPDGVTIARKRCAEEQVEAVRASLRERGWAIADTLDWKAAAREAGWCPRPEAIAAFNDDSSPENCTYCHGVGACPKCWGRSGIERLRSEVVAERDRCAQAALAEEGESARESAKEPDRQVLQGRVFAARSIYNTIVGMK